MFEKLNNVLDAVEHQRDFLKRVSSTGGECELFFGLFVKDDAGLTFDSDDIARLADLALSVSVCVYFDKAE